MITRRGLLGMLAGAIADPERLLWTPGAKLISIPKPSSFSFAENVMRASTYEEAFARFMLERLERELVLKRFMEGDRVTRFGNTIKFRTPPRLVRQQLIPRPRSL